ncbi:hypothetical protein VPNG_01627 [Cytospora leucostoma]|uniref:Aflatoxin regulatory protein domain-containing protein n=1 Tax=Cytospora leucostoma TaxID=1230097 RepID=A0A423XKS5_9PEZI|nr:hypothetical protein VPNG_01627 [Cytospora leucostoma]
MSDAFQGAAACGCWAAAMRIISQTQAPFQTSDNNGNSASSAQKPANSLKLDDMLTLGRNLVQHWEILNACPRSETHLIPLTLRFIADAIGRILELYNAAIENLVLRAREPPRLGASTTSGWTRARPTGASMGDSTGNRGRPLHHNGDSPNPGIFFGNLELVGDEEAAIVSLEALRHSIIQLGIMLQDIEEEHSQHLPEEPSDMEHPLREGDLEELNTKLFRLLGRVHGSDAI